MTVIPIKIETYSASIVLTDYMGKAVWLGIPEECIDGVPQYAYLLHFGLIKA